MKKNNRPNKRKIFLNNKDFIKGWNDTSSLVNKELLIMLAIIAFFWSTNYDAGSYLITISLIFAFFFLLIKLSIFKLSNITNITDFSKDEVKKVSIIDKLLVALLMLGYKSWFLLLIFGLIKSFVYDISLIPSESMKPNLNVGNIVTSNKFDDSYKRGDIVLFKFPLDENKTFIKRIIAIPGDSLEIKDENILLNGQLLKRKYLQEYKYNVKSDDKNSLCDSCEKINNDVLLVKDLNQENNYKILLTSKKHTQSSTPFPIENIFNAKDACEIISPNHIKCVLPSQKYFMMGDNRDNSFDSRYWGFVDKSKITGKATYKNLITKIDE